MMESNSQGRAARTQRTPIAKRQILSVKGKEAGFQYRIVNDQGDRIQQFKDAGYELVKASDVQVGDKRVNKASPEGTMATVSVGKGDKAFIMRQKLEWYDEDQKAKESFLRQQEDTMKQSGGDYGSIDIKGPGR